MKKLSTLLLCCLASCQWADNGQSSTQEDEWLDPELAMAFSKARSVTNRSTNMISVIGGVLPILDGNASYFELGSVQFPRRKIGACQDFQVLQNHGELDLTYKRADFFTVLDGDINHTIIKPLLIQFLDPGRARIIGLPRQDSCTAVELNEYQDSLYQYEIQKFKEFGGEVDYACFHSNADTVLADYVFLPNDTVHKVQWQKVEDQRGSGYTNGSLLRFNVPSRGISFDMNFYPCL